MFCPFGIYGLDIAGPANREYNVKQNSVSDKGYYEPEFRFCQ